MNEVLNGQSAYYFVKAKVAEYSSCFDFKRTFLFNSLKKVSLKFGRI